MSCSFRLSQWCSLVNQHSCIATPQALCYSIGIAGRVLPLLMNSRMWSSQAGSAATSGISGSGAAFSMIA